MQGLKATSNDHIIQSQQKGNQLEQNYIQPTAISLWNVSYAVSN